MKIGNRHFAPKPWAVALYIAVLSCMLWLANWQLDRAALKISLQQSAEQASDAESVPLLSITDLESASASYSKVMLTGQYDATRQFLWDNRTHGGQAGYEVISILRLVNGSLALVNRGWVAPGASRQELPDIALPAVAVGQSVMFEGYLSRPSKGFASGDAVTGVGDWPKLLQYFDYDAIAKELGEPIVPAVVQTQSLGTDARTPTVLTSRPEWLRANWQPAASGPAKHYSYAFQWFAMAVALTSIFLVVNTRRETAN